jgi:predicted RNA-binding protein (virulence factor B family)
MLPIGKRVRLKVLREASVGLILDADGEDLLLPRKFVPAEAAVGDVLNVFVHTDSEDRPVATTQVPLAQVGDFAMLTVKSVEKVGAFMDWGLDKDLLLPFRLQFRPVSAGQKILVYIDLDVRSGRPVASSKLSKFLELPPKGLREGQEVEVVPYQKTEIGLRTVVLNSFEGLLYVEPSSPVPALGEKLTVYVQRIRADGKVDLALGKRGVRAALDASESLLEALSRAGGSLPIGDKSDPDEISDLVGLSKKAFKRAAGSLYRNHKVEIFDHELRVVQNKKQEKK